MKVTVKMGSDDMTMIAMATMRVVTVVMATVMVMTMMQHSW